MKKVKDDYFNKPSIFQGSKAMKSLFQNIQRSAHVDPCVNRSSVAFILRFTGHMTREDIDLQNWSVFDDGELEILFLRRVNRESDSYSGHLCYPGGHRDRNETDFETVVRETLEEVNLNLIGGDFLYIGRVRDFFMPGWNDSPDISITTFGFLALNEIELKLCTKEISNYFWLPLSYFHRGITPFSKKKYLKTMILILDILSFISMRMTINTNSGDLH